MCMASPFVWSCCASAHKRSESPCLPYRVEAHFGFRQAWESLTHSLPYFSYSFLLFHWQLLTQGLTLTNSFSLLLTSYILTSPYWLTSYSLLLTFYSLLAYFSLLTPYFLLLLLILTSHYCWLLLLIFLTLTYLFLTPSQHLATSLHTGYKNQESPRPYLRESSSSNPSVSPCISKRLTPSIPEFLANAAFM